MIGVWGGPSTWGRETFGGFSLRVHNPFYDDLLLAGLILESHGPDSGSKNKFILSFDSSLRDYIYKSQIYPSLINPPLPFSSVDWFAVGLCGDVQDNFSLELDFLDPLSPVNLSLSNSYSRLFLGCPSPVEYGVTYDLSGRVLGAFYLEVPEPPSPPLPPVYYETKPRDPTFPADFQYPYGFSWPFEIQNLMFKPWYYNNYYNDVILSGFGGLPLLSISL